MKRRTLLFTLAALACSTPAFSHHSYAMFDRTKDVKLIGAVKDWKWANPHTFLVLAVIDEHGGSTEWTIEGQSPQVLRLKGWNRDIVKVGDRVTVHILPLKDGSQGGQLVSVLATDGHLYN